MMLFDFNIIEVFCWESVWTRCFEGFTDFSSLTTPFFCGFFEFMDAL